MGSVRSDTRVHALFGSPIGHSLSPVLFNDVFEKLSINRVYLPFEISRDELGDAVRAARTFKFDGFNVTIPHKTRIIEYLDRLDRTAEPKRSVNTVTNEEGVLVGYDTDGEGALRALRSYGFNSDKKQILVIGAGGSSRAIVHSIASQSSQIKILNRTPEKAREIVEGLRGRTNVTYENLSKNSVEASIPGTDLLINATPLQTSSILAQLSVQLNLLKEIGWVFDLAYDKPSVEVPSKFGRISPLEMLLQQAALSYEIWMREPAPLELMRSAMTSHLGGDWR